MSSADTTEASDTVVAPDSGEDIDASNKSRMEEEGEGPKVVEIKNVKVVLDDGGEFEFPLHLSSTINNIIDDMGIEAEEVDKVPVNGISSKTFGYIIDFTKIHPYNEGFVDLFEKGDIDSQNTVFRRISPMSSPDLSFFESITDIGVIFDLFKAANYLQLSTFLHYISKFLAEQIKPLLAEEIDMVFNEKPDTSTEEEKKEIFDKYPWMLTDYKEAIEAPFIDKRKKKKEAKIVEESDDSKVVEECGSSEGGSAEGGSAEGGSSEVKEDIDSDSDSDEDEVEPMEVSADGN